MYFKDWISLTISTWNSQNSRSLQICFDSMEVLIVLQNMTTVWDLTRFRLKKLNSPAKKRDVELLEIPVFNGIRSNEIAEDLARLEAA